MGHALVRREGRHALVLMLVVSIHVHTAGGQDNLCRYDIRHAGEGAIISLSSGLGSADNTLCQCDVTRDGSGSTRLTVHVTLTSHHDVTSGSCTPYVHSPFTAQSFCPGKDEVHLVNVTIVTGQDPSFIFSNEDAQEYNASLRIKASRYVTVDCKSLDSRPVVLPESCPCTGGGLPVSGGGSPGVGNAVIYGIVGGIILLLLIIIAIAVYKTCKRRRKDHGDTYGGEARGTDRESAAFPSPGDVYTLSRGKNPLTGPSKPVHRRAIPLGLPRDRAGEDWEEGVEQGGEDLWNNPAYHHDYRDDGMPDLGESDHKAGDLGKRDLGDTDSGVIRDDQSTGNSGSEPEKIQVSSL